MNSYDLDDTLEEGRVALLQLERQLKDQRDSHFPHNTTMSNGHKMNLHTERKLLDQKPRDARLKYRKGSPLGLTVEEMDDRGLLDGGGTVPKYYTSHRQRQRRYLELRPRVSRVRDHKYDTKSKTVENVLHMLRVLVRKGLHLEAYFHEHDAQQRGIVTASYFHSFLHSLHLPISAKDYALIMQRYALSEQYVDYETFLSDVHQEFDDVSETHVSVNTYTNLITEMKRMILHSMRHGHKSEDDVYRMFSKWDRGGLGTITVTQFFRVLSHLHIHFNDHDQDFLVELLDSTNSGMIDFEHILSYCFNEEDGQSASSSVNTSTEQPSSGSHRRPLTAVIRQESPVAHPQRPLTASARVLTSEHRHRAPPPQEIDVIEDNSLELLSPMEWANRHDIASNEIQRPTYQYDIANNVTADEIPEDVELACISALRDTIISRHNEGKSLREIYSHFDRRGVGYFDRKDFQQALFDICINPPDDIKTKMLQYIALDGIDRASFGEFVVFVTDPEHRELQEKVQQQIADQLEQQGRSYQYQLLQLCSGKSIVSVTEFKDVLSKICLKLSANEMDRLLTRFDVHGNQEYSLSRFLRMCQNSTIWNSAMHNVAYQEEASEEAHTIRQRKHSSHKVAIHHNYSDELIDMAEYLGIRLLSEPQLIWIVEEALTAPLPDGWTIVNENNRTFFYHKETNTSRWDHPLDPYFRKQRDEHRMKLNETSQHEEAAKPSIDQAVWKDSHQTRPASAPIKQRKEFVPSTVVERAIMQGRDKKRHNSVNHINSSTRNHEAAALKTAVPHTAQKNTRPSSAQRSRNMSRNSNSHQRSKDTLEQIPPELRPMYGDEIVNALDKRFSGGEAQKHRHKETSERNAVNDMLSRPVDELARHFSSQNNITPMRPSDTVVKSRKDTGSSRKKDTTYML